MKELSVKRMMLFVILLGSAVGCLLLGLKVRQVTCDNVYVLSFTQEHKNFLSSDISIVEDNDVSFTYTKYLYPEISNGFRAEEATVIATNDNYAYFSRMQIRSGAFFNSVHENRKMAVAVLNEAAAYQMFGNYDCVGESIYLNQNAFVVVGIIKESGNVDESKIYVPEKTTEHMGIAGSEVNQLWCRFANMAETSVAISKMGYSMDEIDITQMDLYKGVFMQRFWILLILAGIIPFVRIWREAFAKTKELRQGAGGNRSWIIKWIFQIAICVGGLILILKIIQLAWFIPPNYDVVGKSWLEIFYEILEFYALSGIKMDNMYFLNRWNLLSLFCFTICITGIMLCKIVTVTNYYFMSRNKELMQTYFAEKSEWGVLGEEYTIVDEPYLGYRCHLNKLSCGWRPLFQKHKVFDSFRKLEAFYREHQADLEIYDEYRRQYSWEEYFETVYAHSRCHPEPMKWVYEVNPMSPDKKPHLRTVGCSEGEAELYSPFNHIEYEKTLLKARQKFGVYEREYGDIKYWNDPDYLFDWTEGEFM